MTQLDLGGGRNAREQFENQAARMLASEMGDKIEGDDRERFNALVCLFGAAFGVPHREMSGDRDATTEIGKLGLARMLVYAWGPKRDVNKTTVGGRGFNPYAVVRGLVRAIGACQSFPTEGLLAELIRGGDAEHYPGGMLAGQTVPPRPLKSDGAIAGALMAEEFHLESERLGLDPDRPVSDAIGKRRTQKLRELIGPGWGLMPTEKQQPKPGEDIEN
jgi:hypothetical protein